MRMLDRYVNFNNKFKVHEAGKFSLKQDQKTSDKVVDFEEKKRAKIS